MTDINSIIPVEVAYHELAHLELHCLQVQLFSWHLLIIRVLALVKFFSRDWAYQENFLKAPRGWSGGAMVLGKLPVPGRPTIWMIVGQGPIVLAVGAGRGIV